MILIIAEKAIAGRRIAAFLAGKQLPGERTGNAIHFDFEKDGKQYTVVPLSGHIVDVDFPQTYKQWLGTDLRKLVEAEIKYGETEANISGLIKKIAPNIDEVIIATDADREGEAIGLEALNILRSKNEKVVIKRAIFSAITEKDIKESFANLEKLDFDLAESANSRREIDLIWGAVLTRFLSLISGRLGKEFLSTGRVQGPTLALIVDKEKERNAFVFKKYWLFQAFFEKDSKKFEASHKTGKFWEKAEAEKALACKEPPKGIVAKVQKKKRILVKPLPFNTTSFLRAATSIGLSAGGVMQIAESLYQSGYISYPRTDNSVYPKTLDLRATLSELSKVQEFSPLANELLKQEKLVPSAGKLAKDHPPIYPVTAVQKSKLDAQQWKIYELVCRRFMATLAKDALTENLTVDIDLNKEPFVATGQIYLEMGWKKFYPYSKATEVILPSLSQGDEVKLLSLDLLEKETQPPARYSQGSLIKAMSDLNLGTKSTRAETIQKLYYRKYIEGQKALIPTKIAFAVINSLQKHDSVVVKPEMTANLEKEMDLVASGTKKKDEVVTDSRQFLSDALKLLLEHKNEIGSELRHAARADSIVGPCSNPKCDGELLIRHGRTGKRFLGCSAYPKCTVTYPLPQKGRITILVDKCESCGNIMMFVLGKRYRYKMCIDPKCKSKADWGKKKAEKEKKTAEEKEANRESKEAAAGNAKESNEKEAGKKPAKAKKARATAKKKVDSKKDSVSKK